jgi:hypothetical protein
VGNTRLNWPWCWEEGPMFIKVIVEIEYSSTGRQKIKNKIKSTGTVRDVNLLFLTNIGTCTSVLYDILYGDFNYDLIQFGYTPVHMYIYLHDTCVYTHVNYVIHIHICERSCDT